MTAYSQQTVCDYLCQAKVARQTIKCNKALADYAKLKEAKTKVLNYGLQLCGSKGFYRDQNTLLDKAKALQLPSHEKPQSLAIKSIKFLRRLKWCRTIRLNLAKFLPIE
jgi:hypothetical protein